MAPFLATYVGSTPICVSSVFRRLRPAAAGFAIAFVWLATTGTAIAAPAASTWSLLPHPADVRLAPSGVVKIVDGALVAVSGADRQQVQPIADRFMQLVANTRGLQLRMADTADAHPAITFDLDPQASVVGATGYRLEVGAQGIRVIAPSPPGAFYRGVTLSHSPTTPASTPHNP